jgi:periplasmic protein TonB
MSAPTPAAPDVFSAQEIARAAGVPVAEVERLIRAGRLATVKRRFVPAGPAINAVRRLQGPRGHVIGQPSPGVFQLAEARRYAPGRALAASGAAHAALLAGLAIVTAGTVQDAKAPLVATEPARLVFVASPGPGGGGGGGGLRQPAPPARAQVRGPAAVLRSPVPPPRRAVDVRPVERPVRPPPVRPQPVASSMEPPPPVPVTTPVPQVVAPVATVAADPADRAGVLADAAPDTSRNGPGAGGGAGTGAGTGIGEGQGPGIGQGSGGGTGGGPYRPGSGITPPSITREVKPEYTQEARRRGIAGDVIVEIIVRSDGSVGQVRLLQGLGAGLDQRAMEAVRQWRFSPAHRYGTPVDVVVEVAVEFKLR